MCFRLSNVETIKQNSISIEKYEICRNDPIVVILALNYELDLNLTTCTVYCFPGFRYL